MLEDRSLRITKTIAAPVAVPMNGIVNIAINAVFIISEPNYLFTSQPSTVCVSEEKLIPSFMISFPLARNGLS